MRSTATVIRDGRARTISRTAFTLVELVLVLGLMILLLRLSTLAFSSIKTARTLDSAAHEVFSVMQYAREVAMSQNGRRSPSSPTRRVR